MKVETDQFVICLVLPECLSVKICCISPSSSEANRDGADAESPFPLSFSFSASFKNSSPKEKVGNCLRFGTGGWSLCFYPLWSRNIWIFFPTLTMAARSKKKILAKRFAYAVSRHYRDLEHPYVYWIWLGGSTSYVIKYDKPQCVAFVTRSSFPMHFSFSSGGFYETIQHREELGHDSNIDIFGYKWSINKKTNKQTDKKTNEIN